MSGSASSPNWPNARWWATGRLGGREDRARYRRTWSCQAGEAWCARTTVKTVRMIAIAVNIAVTAKIVRKNFVGEGNPAAWHDCDEQMLALVTGQKLPYT